jgi:arginine:ornithine antiporter/lysine permease
MYAWARREQNVRLFSPIDLIIFAVTAAAGLIGLYGLLSGTITP